MVNGEELPGNDAQEGTGRSKRSRTASSMSSSSSSMISNESNDEKTWLLLSSDPDSSRHESMLPTHTRRQKRQTYTLSRSNTGGFPGVKTIDQNNPLHPPDKTTLQAFKDEYVALKAAASTYWEEAKNAGDPDHAEDFLLEMTLTRTLSIMPDKQALTEVADGFSDALKDAAQILRKLPSVLGGEPPSPPPPYDSIGKMDLSDWTEETTTVGTLTPDTTTYIKKIPEIDEETATGTAVVANESSETSPSPIKPGNKKIPVHAYVTLLTAVTALSSIGPFLDKLDGVPAPLRIVWRQQGTALVLWPFAVRSVVKDGPPKLSVAQWCTFLLASFSYAVLTVAFSMSVDYTTVNDAAILTNSQSLLLVVAKLCLGNSVHYLESTGVLVAFGGAYLCSRDSSEAAQIMDDHTNPWLSLYGDGLAVLSAIGGLGYIMLGKSLRNHVEVYVFMTLNMLIGSTMILSFMTLTGQTWTFDRHIDHGMFGWMNLTTDRIVVELCVVFICNLCGTMGYVRAFKYFSSVIIAVAALLEPVTATLIAIALGVGVFPGVLGCIGNVMVIVGTLAVIYPSAMEE